MNNTKILLLSGLAAAALLSGCSSSTDTATAATTDTETTHDIGYLVDSAVANVNYDCLEDNTTGITDEDGAFSCTHMKKIRFRIGQAILGEIETLPEDGYVFPQDLVNVDREAGLNDENVTAMVQLLQALDSDNNASNGIEIPEDTKEILTETTTITPDTVVEIANQTDVSLVEKEDAIAHLQETMHRLSTTLQEETQQELPDDNITQQLQEEHGNRYGQPEERNITIPTDMPHEENLTQEEEAPRYGADEEHNMTMQEPHRIREHNATTTEVLPTDENSSTEVLPTTQPSTPEEVTEEETTEEETPATQTASSLTPELQEALAHMGNEERLAYDVYSNLYNYHMNNGTEITQLNNIAQNSETQHVDKVQTLVRTYGLDATTLDVVDATVVETQNIGSDISQESMPSGVYDIPAIQELYNELYAKGQESQQAALEVGCMVEVVDVEDLDRYIEMAEESNASDIEQTFQSLRSASYSHYNSFNDALKKIGIEDGCCSLGEQWCQTYTDNRGKGHSNE